MIVITSYSIHYTKLYERVGEQMNSCDLIRNEIESQLHDDPPTLINKGNVIKSGVNAELDELRTLLYSGKDVLMDIQQRETERTGITSLKVAFNNVFGYYIEVRNTHKDRITSYNVCYTKLLRALSIIWFLHGCMF